MVLLDAVDKLLAPSTVRVSVVGHPIDVDAHPHIPPGWRWCVMLGADPWEDKTRMLNAGWCASKGEMFMEGEMVGIAVAKALAAVGHQIDYQVTELDYDPIPRGE